MLADGMTKALPTETFKRHRALLGMAIDWKKGPKTYPNTQIAILSGAKDGYSAWLTERSNRKLAWWLKNQTIWETKIANRAWQWTGLISVIVSRAHQWRPSRDLAQWYWLDEASCQSPNEERESCQFFAEQFHELIDFSMFFEANVFFRTYASRRV